MKKIIAVFVFLFGMLPMLSQEAPNNNTTICWDVSSSMVTRDLEKDLSVLEKIFQRNGNQQVQLLLFGVVIEEKNYAVQNGAWSELKKDLQHIKYDGGTIYSTLQHKIKNPNVYVFTDGQKNLSKDVLALDGKSFLINSNPARDAKFLERTALLNKSRLMDFATMLPENVEKLQQKPKKQIQQNPTIKGTVYIDNKPAADVKVTIKGISDSFLTGAAGDFDIPAQVGDTLVVTSRKSKTIRMMPVEAMVHLNVFMTSNIVALDEVVVVEKELEKSELTLTGYGLQRQDEIGYAVSEIDASEISAVTTTITDAINTKVPGLDVRGKIELNGQVAGGLGSAKIRGSGTLNMNTDALVVVNGVPQRRSETNNVRGIDISTNANLDYIDPANIANITVLKGLAATNAWGSEGRGGVILITTKTAVHGTGQKGKPVDQALLKNNVYDESQGEMTSNTSPTITALKKSKSVSDAYNSYLALKSLNQSSVTFFLEAFEYFKRKDAKLAGSIISNLLESNAGDIEVLKVVSKAFATIGEYENVIRLNEEIIKISPSDVNAYFNSAKAKIELGKYQEALRELLALEKGNTYFSVNASGISKTLKREIKNLISKHKSQLNLTSVDAEYLNNVKYKGRLVFEWNVPAAEFELQFVNPQKRFFNWEHTNSSIGSRIEDELKNNFRIEEYEFYGDVEGKWVINAKYLGGATATEKVPLVLKTTIYKDFGYPTQNKEEILVHFSQPNEKRNLKTLAVN